MTTRLALLHGFELIRSGGTHVSLCVTAQRVLAFLALQSRPILRGHVAGALWLDRPDERAAANLRTALWQIHKQADRIVESNWTHLWLASGISVDVHQMVTAARSVLAGTTDSEGSALDLQVLSGDLLPDWYDEWVVVERERLRQLRLHALEALAEQLTAASRFSEAAEAALLAIAGEPLRESAHRALLRVYLAEGNRREAVRHCEVFRDVLGEDLALDGWIAPELPVRWQTGGAMSHLSSRDAPH